MHWGEGAAGNTRDDTARNALNEQEKILSKDFKSYLLRYFVNFPYIYNF